MQQLIAQLKDSLTTTALPTQSLSDMAIALGSSILFGYILRRTYIAYFADNEPQDSGFARSLVAIIPALTVTFMVIQSSLALSLGLLGSLSFVRFRSNLKRAEEVSFILVAIATAIACGVGMPLAAVALTALMYGYAVSRRLSGRRRKSSHFAVISYSTRKPVDVSALIAKLESCHLNPEFVSSRAYDGITSFVFNACHMTPSAHTQVSSALSELDQDSQINIFHPSEHLGA